MKPRPVIGDHPARILIVDDELHNRQLLEVMLKPEGFVVLTAESGEEALAIVAQQTPDLVLLDVMMPGMDGFEVARRIKGDFATKNIPVIVVTALDDHNARMLGLTAGAEDFLTKPVDRAELCMRVRNLLRLKAYGDYHGHYSQLLEGEVSARTADLVESEKRFRQLAETIREVFFLVDPRIAQVFYVSPAYEVIFGRTGESLYAHPQDWVDAVHPADRERVLETMMPKGTLLQFDVEYRIVRPDGGERFIRARGFPINDEDGDVYRFAGIAEDITERRALAVQVRQAGERDTLVQAASGVAHDFSRLLTAILDSAELLTSDLAVAQQHGDALGEVIKAARRASGLTR